MRIRIGKSISEFGEQVTHPSGGGKRISELGEQILHPAGGGKRIKMIKQERDEEVDLEDNPGDDMDVKMKLMEADDDEKNDNKYSAKSDIEYLMGEEEIENDKEPEMSENVQYEEQALEIKKEFENGWQIVDSLPPGWKFREILGSMGTRQFMLSPKGKIFPCRRLALKYMIENSFPQDDLATMKQMLVHERWQDHTLLPEGWLYRDDTVTAGNSKEFISMDGVLHRSFKHALAYLKGSPYVSYQVLQNMEEFNLSVMKKSRSDMDWREDENLPPDWKTKKGFNCDYFLCPSGERQFQGRRMALQFMIQNGHSEDDTEVMRKSMVAEGWIKNDCLPEGWLVKENGSQGKNLTSAFLLSREGHLFKSCKNAIDYMKLNKSYNEDDMENILKIYKKVQNNKRIDEYGWVTSESLPPGWKMRSPPGSDKKFFISSDGQSFNARRLALQFMIENKFDRLEIDQMRLSMEEDGWKTSEHLPTDWIYKVIITSSKQYSVNINILSDQADKFESYLSAIKFMESSEKYCDKDIEGVNKLLAENTKDWRKSTFLVDTSKVDHPLPKGWRVRPCGSRNYIVSPQGQQFPTRKKALQSMIQEEIYEDQDVEMMRTSMQDEGWKFTDLLPLHWIYKTGEGEHRKDAITILTETGEPFHSYLAVIKYMEAGTEFGEVDIRNVNQLLSVVKGVRTGVNVKQEVDLPAGWWSRTLGQHNFIISPEGEQFANKRKALESMAQNGAFEEDKNIMRKSMEDDGWRTSELLPPGWLFKYVNINSSTKVDLVTQDGIKFSSYVSAIKYLESTPLYNEEDVGKLSLLSEENTKSSRIAGTRAYIKSEAEEATLGLEPPPGWKVCVVGKHRYMVSPQGEMFKSLRKALQHMVKQGFQDQELEAMRRCLGQDGWQTSEFLPKNWLFKVKHGNAPSKQNIQNIHILTEEGEQLESYLAAIKILESDPRFGLEDVEKINELISHNTKSWRLKAEQLSIPSAEEVTLPEGWRTRVCGTQHYTVSPEGEQFQSRRKALQHMVAKGNPPNQVELMRDAMAADGWVKSDLLPNDWRYHSNEKRRDNAFLLPDGEVIRGKEIAVTKLDSQEQRYDLAMLCKMRAVRRREDHEGWEEDDNTLPEGWKSRRSGQSKIFISPDGSQFMNRRLAIKRMLEDGCPEKMLERVRSGLAEEGWEEDIQLPCSWRFKTIKGGSGQGKEHLKLLTAGGDTLEGRDAALSLVKAGQEYSEKEFEQLKIFIDIQRVRATSVRYEWNENDDTIPEGWKSRFGGSKQFFLSPDGLSFPCRRAGLQYMVKERFEEEEVEEMRDLLKHEGWQRSEDLPRNWLLKPPSDTAAHYSFHFVNELGDKLESTRAAVDYVKKTDADNTEDMAKLSKFSRQTRDQSEQGLCIRKVKVEKSFEISIKQEPTDKIIIQQEIKVESKTKGSKTALVWEEDPSLPVGWKTRLGKGGMEIFMTAGGQQLVSRHSALDHLLRTGAAQVNIKRSQPPEYCKTLNSKNFRRMWKP